MPNFFHIMRSDTTRRLHIWREWISIRRCPGSVNVPNPTHVFTLKKGIAIPISTAICWERSTAKPTWRWQEDFNHVIISLSEKEINLASDTSNTRPTLTLINAWAPRALDIHLNSDTTFIKGLSQQDAYTHLQLCKYGINVRKHNAWLKANRKEGHENQ
jgi:hypothetical protein